MAARKDTINPFQQHAVMRVPPPMCANLRNLWTKFPGSYRADQPSALTINRFVSLVLADWAIQYRSWIAACGAETDRINAFTETGDRAPSVADTPGAST